MVRIVYYSYFEKEQFEEVFPDANGARVTNNPDGKGWAVFAEVPDGDDELVCSDGVLKAVRAVN